MSIINIAPDIYFLWDSIIFFPVLCIDQWYEWNTAIPCSTFYNAAHWSSMDLENYAASITILFSCECCSKGTITTSREFHIFFGKNDGLLISRSCKWNGKVLFEFPSIIVVIGQCLCHYSQFHNGIILKADVFIFSLHLLLDARCTFHLILTAVSSGKKLSVCLQIDLANLEYLSFFQW